MANIKVGAKVMFRGYEADGVYTVRSITENGKVGVIKCGAEDMPNWLNLQANPSELLVL